MMDWWFLCITVVTGAILGANGFYMLTNTDPNAGLAIGALTMVVAWSWTNMAQKWHWEHR